MSRSHRCSEAQWAFSVALLVTSVYAFLVSTKGVHALAPFGTYEQVFQYADGQISVNQTAQLYLSNDESGGEFEVGEHTVRVQSVPPRLLYRAREVGRIPKSVTLHTEEVCLVVSRADAEALDSANKPPSAQDDSSAVGRRLLTTSTYLTEHGLDGEGYAQTAFYADRCKAGTFFDYNIAASKLNTHDWRLKIGALYENLSAKTQNIAIRESTYMRRIKGLLNDGRYNILMTGHDYERDFVMAELVLISQMYIDVLTPDQSDWRVTVGCRNLYGRCYTHRFMDFEMTNPSQDCRTSPNPPSNCDFTAIFRTLPSGQKQGYTYRLTRDVFLGVGPDRLLCKPYMADAATYGSGSGSTGKFDMKDLVTPFVTAFEAYAQSYADGIGAQVAANVANSEWAKSVGLSLEAASNATAAQKAVNDQNEVLWQKQAGINQKVNDQDVAIAKAMTMITDAGRDATNQLNNAIAVTDLRITELNELQSKQVNQKFNDTLRVVAKVAEIQAGQFQQLYKGVQDVSDMLQAVNAQLSAYIQQKQYNRLITQSFYDSIDKLALQGGEVPLVSSDGIRPRRLSGQGLKLLIDQAYVVYNTTGSSRVRSIALSFFADSHIMLNISRTWTTVDQLVNWMGFVPCLIRADLRSVTQNCSVAGANCTEVVREWDDPIFANRTDPVTNKTLPFCTLWTEAVVLDCPSGYRASDNTCAGPGTNSTKKLTTSQDFLGLLNQQCDSSVVGTNITVSSATLGIKIAYQLQDKTVCNSTLQEKLLEQTRGRPDPTINVLSYTWMAYMSAMQTRLRTLELLTYGSLPNGIKTEVRTLGYSPGPDFGFAAGGQASQCMRGYWLSVNPQTLPITSLTFDSQSSKDSDVNYPRIVVDIARGPACQFDANETIRSDCYVVKNSDLRVNYAFQDSNGVNIPPALAVVGDVTSPLFSGLYDVPASLIETTKNPLVRSNLLTYLLMPAGTETTLTFEHFNRLSGGLFDAYDGSASATEYKFPVVLDNDGYPVCNIASGLPVAATFTPPVDLCVPPFVWSGADFVSLTNSGYTLAPPASGPGCPALVPAPLLGISDMTVFPNRTELVFARLKQEDNFANSGISDLQMYGTLTKMNVFPLLEFSYGPPAWTVSAWVTRTAPVPWEAMECTIFSTSVKNGPVSWRKDYHAPHDLVVGLGSPSGFPGVRQTVFVRINAGLTWVPSADPIDFPLNTPVFISVVFLMGEQAAWNEHLDHTGSTKPLYRIQLYVNGILHGNTSSIYHSLLTRHIAADAAIKKVTQSYKGFWDENSVELMHLYSSPLSSAQIASEMVCQLNSYSISDGVADAVSPSNFALPLAVCTMLDATSSLGYCRHTAMCGGNCAVYASVNRVALTFRAMQVVCDPGWLSPNCVERCKLVDEAGNCLSQVQDLTLGSGDMRGLADAYSVNGYWCQILKNYQVAPYSVNGQSFVSLSYRTYQYLADVTIPSGRVTTIVPRGYCPSVTLQPNGDGSLWMMFTNVYADRTKIRIEMQGGQGAECAPPNVCCVGSQSLTLEPYSTTNWAVPTLCSLMQVEVLLDLGPGGFESCTSLNSATVADKINQVRSDPVPANVARNVITASNQVLEQLASITKEMAIQSVRLTAQAVEAALHGTDITNLLTNVTNAINNAPLPNITGPNPPLNNPYDNPNITKIFDEIDKRNNDTKNAIDEQGNSIKTLGELNAQYSTMQKAFSDSVEAQRVANDAFRAQVVVSNDIMRDSVLRVEAAYGDLLYAVSQLRAKADDEGGVGGTGLSSATMGLLITGCVLGTLAAVASAVPLVPQYGPELVRKMKGLRKSSSEGEEGDSDDDESGDESGEEGSGEETEDEGSQQQQPQQANSAAQAIMLARESYMYPHH